MRLGKATCCRRSYEGASRGSGQPGARALWAGSGRRRGRCVGAGHEVVHRSLLEPADECCGRRGRCCGCRVAGPCSCSRLPGPAQVHSHDRRKAAWCHAVVMQGYLLLLEYQDPEHIPLAGATAEVSMAAAGPALGPPVHAHAPPAEMTRLSGQLASSRGVHEARAVPWQTAVVSLQLSATGVG